MDLVSSSIRHLFPFLDALNGTSVVKKLGFYEKSSLWNRSDIDDFQAQKLKDLVNHAYNYVPYYTDLFNTLNLKPSDISSPSDLNKLPILTKDLVRSNFKKLHSTNNSSKISYSKTSGSTGTPLSFAYDPEAYSWNVGKLFHHASTFGFRFGDKQVKISSIPSSHVMSLKKQTFARSKFFYLDNNSSSSEKIIEELNSFKPSLIRGHPSRLYELALYMQSNNKFLSKKPLFIMSFAENLQPLFRKNIEQSFNAPVIDQYGAGGEMVFIASECSFQDKYHLNEEAVIVSNRENLFNIPTPAILTPLHNYSMPLINYQIGDMVSFSDSLCSCGNPRKTLNSVNGREYDCILTPLDKKISVSQFFSPFKTAKNIRIHQFVQPDKHTLNLNIVKNDSSLPVKGIENVVHNMQLLTENTLSISVNYVDSIPSLPSGKISLLDSYVYRK